MAKKVYARRYAQAVFELALVNNELERWQSDLQRIAGALGDAAFLAVLDSPKIRFEDKTALLSGRLGEISPLALNLVHLLISRNSIRLIGKINEEYQRLLDAYHGIERAEVITAIPLDDSYIKKLNENLSALVGKKVKLELKVDPAVMGGFVARVGGKLLDGSTQNRLKALRRELVGMERKR